MSQIRNPVAVCHPKQPGVVRDVPEPSVRHWRRVGWKPVAEVEAEAEAAETKGKAEAAAKSSRRKEQ